MEKEGKLNRVNEMNRGKMLERKIVRKELNRKRSKIRQNSKTDRERERDK